MQTRLTPEIAREFLRVCKKADPTGEYTAIYRSVPLFNELWDEAEALAKPELKVVANRQPPE